MTSAYDFTFQALTSGQAMPLSAFKGKVILIVNTASKCGFTWQYSGLESLYKTYQDRGLVVIGVPCDDFGHQEPAEHDVIAEFCQVNYGVTFPMMQKEHVRGKEAHPFYVWAKKTLGFGTGPKWNFHKYLIDREGQLVDYFNSTTKPENQKMITAIEAQLEKKSVTLFTPLKVGALTLPNRLIMSPLTRARAGENRIPNAMMAQYYSERASAGLIISEATSVCPMGVGYANTPGIWSDEQVAGWQLITQAVHEKGGRIFLQLWHVGRISDPMFLNGELPVAPSAITPAGKLSLVRPEKAYVTPRALETDEIPALVEAYRKGAENAKKAGFDGVAIHGSNGYLLDQFLQDSTNHRTDAYGGSIENRARLILEVTDALISVWGADRVGMHIAPRCDTHNMGDSDRLSTFSYVAKELGKRKIAFLFSREKQGEGYIGDQLKKAFGGVYIANQELTQADAERLIESGLADAVAFGRLFIANPDLPERFLKGAPLNKPSVSTFYAGEERGYIDYPKLN